MESVRDQRIAAFLALDDGYGDGSGDGSGSGSGWNDGSGYGFGEGSGEGWGFRSGGGFGGGPCLNDGSGSGFDDGSGYGGGFDSGCGAGSGCGWGFGSVCGFDDGSSIKSFCGSHVYMIDDIPTIIDRVAGGIAKGRILRNDMTTTPCFVVKGRGYFVHGDTLRGAMNALRDKQFDGLPEDERIDALIKAHEHGKQYPWLICTSGTTN